MALLASVLSHEVLAQSPTTAPPINAEAFVTQFEATLGKFPGYRRSGAKGICATGEFIGTQAARALSRASVFSGQPIPAIVRFSMGGAEPNAPDNVKSQRNMALQFNLPGGELWQLSNISVPVFATSTPEQALGLLVSRQDDPVTHLPDPVKVKAFNDAHPEVLVPSRYLASQPVPASFGGVNYWGVHAFGFVNAAGSKRFGKWIFEPLGGLQSLTDEEAMAKGPSFLFDELRHRVKSGAVGFNFNLELAIPGDILDNATVPLPVGREKVHLGQLRITSVAEDGGGACLTITFNPLVLPQGIVASADPVLAARAAPYAVGLERRLREGAKQ